MTENGSGARSLLYLLGGVAIGAGLGVLLAPSKETRRNIKEWLEKEGDTLRQQKERLAVAYKAGKRAYAETNEKVPA